VHGSPARPTAEQIHRMNREMAGVEATARSTSGLVAAVVGVRHDVRSLWIDPHVYRVRDADALASDVKEAVRAACDEADRRALGVAGAVFPEGPNGDLAYDPLLRELDELTGEGED
jgi:DNA-binding protein YbaB